MNGVAEMRRLRLSPWTRRVVRNYLVPVWFLVFAVVHVLDIVPEARLGFDARIYHRAASVWLQGGDPWASYIPLPEGKFHFAGLPPTVIVFALLGAIPEHWIGSSSVVICGIAALWMVRRLGLAWWWLLFPPLVQGVLLGQPGVLVLALLLVNHPAAEATAASLKVYALVPMVARLRLSGILAFVLFAGFTVIVFRDLWVLWIQQGAAIAGRLVAEVSGGVGATAYWWLLPPTLIALAVIAILDRAAAGWLAVPALWPSAQFHYPVMALPAIRIIPALAFAVPVFGMPAVAVMLHAYLEVRDYVLSRSAPPNASSRMR